MKMHYLFILLGLSLFTSCSSTPEAELKRFEQNIKDLEGISAKFPAFRPAVEYVKKDAIQQMEDAKKLQDGDAKLNALVAANKTARPAFVNHLNDIESLMNNLPGLYSKVTQTAKEETDISAARTANYSNEEILYQAKNNLSSARVSNTNEANAISASILETLKAAEKRMNDILERIEEKNNAAEAADKEKQKEEEAAKSAEEAKKQPIKCKYCSVMCEAGSTKCKSCGAPLQ
jgi:hypothetical protein